MLLLFAFIVAKRPPVLERDVHSVYCACVKLFLFVLLSFLVLRMGSRI